MGPHEKWSLCPSSREGELFIIPVSRPAFRVFQFAAQLVFLPEQLVEHRVRPRLQHVAVDFLLNSEQLSVDAAEPEDLDAHLEVADWWLTFGRNPGQQLRLLIG